MTRNAPSKKRVKPSKKRVKPSKICCIFRPKLSPDLIKKILADKNDQHHNRLTASPGGYLTGRRGEYAVAKLFLRSNQLVKWSNSHNYDLLVNKRRYEVKTTTLVRGGKVFVLSYLDQVFDLMVIVHLENGVPNILGCLTKSEYEARKEESLREKVRHPIFWDRAAVALPIASLRPFTTELDLDSLKTT